MNSVVRHLLNKWNDMNRKRDMIWLAELRLQDESKKLKDQRKEFLIEAVAFWRFFYENSRGMTTIDRREFLNQVDPGKNYLLELVLIVEILPVSVWRKVLWRYNIDFKSMESFLRRISHEESLLIVDNYKDLFADGAIPRVFSRVTDRIKIQFKKITVKSLLTEEEDRNLRYSHRSTWAESLGDLDFGFAAYQKDDLVNGVYDDEKTTWINKLDFFRKKNRKGFVVNWEDGRYAWLYKTARSNFVMNSGADVQLKDNICPGFWWTMLVCHFNFWITSPICFMIIAMTAMFSGGLFAIGSFLGLESFGVIATILVYAFSVITPGWCFAAICKLAYLKIRQPVGNFFRLSGSFIIKGWQWLEDHDINLRLPLSDKSREGIKGFASSCWSFTKQIFKDVVKPVGFILLVAVCVFCVTVFVGWVIFEACDKFLFPAFGMGYTVFTLLIAVYYAFIRNKYDIQWKNDWKDVILIPIWLFVASVIGMVSYKYGMGMLGCGKGLVQMFWNSSLVFKAFLFFYIVMPVVTVFFIDRMDQGGKPENNVMDKMFILIEKYWKIGTIIITILLGITASHYDPIGFLYIFAGVLVSGILYFFVTYGYDSRVQRMEVANKGIACYRDKECFREGFAIRGFAENKWLLQMNSIDSQKRALRRIWNLALNIAVGSRLQPRDLYEYIAARANDKSLKLLNSNLGWIKSNHYVFRKYFVKEVLSGKTVAEANRIARDKCARDKIVEARWDKISDFLGKTNNFLENLISIIGNGLLAIFWTYSFSWVWKSVAFIGVVSWKIGVYVITAIWLKDFLSKNCPIAEKQGPIDI